jgi:hypothetical protein
MMKEHRMKPARERTRLLLLFIGVLFLGAAMVAEATDNFVIVSLPKGVSIELPKNWIGWSNNQRITLDTLVESRLDLAGYKQETSELSFAANYFNDRGTTIGILNIRYYPQLDVTQTDVLGATSHDVQELDAELKDKIHMEMKAFGRSITAWIGTIKTEINGITAFITEYRRSPRKGSGEFQVRLVRVFAGDRSFTLTVSYLNTASMVLRPITDRIISSLKLTGVGVSTSQTLGTHVTETSGGSSGMSKLYGEQLGLVLLGSVLLTWGIGLTPPLLIRFVFVRRPIGKGWAIGVVAVFWMANLLFFTAFGSQSKTHFALVLVAMASYAILRKGKKEVTGPA